MYKRQVYHGVAFVSDYDSSEVVEPADCPFDFPPACISSKLSTILSLRLFPVAPMRTDKLYAPLLESVAKLVAVCGSVVN